jgi:hypothetical protein
MEYEEIVAVVRQASGGIGSEAADRQVFASGIWTLAVLSGTQLVAVRRADWPQEYGS